MAATPSADIPQFEISSGDGPEGARVVRIVGEVDMSHEEELRAELRSAVSSKSRGVVVDLTECEFIDSSGVRALLQGYDAQRAEDEPARLAVAASSEQIIRILSVMGVDKVIPVRPTPEEAIAELPG